ncbi:hypothetical protein [Streptomyces sp. NPDC086787]|uniref:hypothetical protein n=1 Tax=Streptomyces sp. NPDC086787 TaxID=3365759 RepID=UPI0037FD60F1
MVDHPDSGAGEVPGAVPETFVFVCARCGYMWQEEFQVVFFTDPVSLDTQEYVDEAGRAMRSPLSDAVCERCGGRNVRVTTPELAARPVRGAAPRHEHRFHLHRHSADGPGEGHGSGHGSG